MCPEIITIGPFTIYSYGLMLATGFLVGSTFLTAELKRRKLNRNIARSFYLSMRWLYLGLTALILVAAVAQFGSDVLSAALQTAGRNRLFLLVAVAYVAIGWFIIRQASQAKPRSEIDLATAVVLIALVYGVIGTKILFLLENMSDVLRRPFDMLISTSGLSFFGGPVLVIIALFVVLKKEGISFFSVADATAPSLLLGYGIGRLGCHFAGDGCYGFPTSLPWGTDYSHGVVPPSQALSRFPEVAGQFPNGIPDTTPLHPTPVYEFLACALLFIVLWRLRTSVRVEGRIFMLYLIFAGLERFAVEFLRLNPRVLFGISGFQIFAFLMAVAGLLGWYLLGRRAQKAGTAA